MINTISLVYEDEISGFIMKKLITLCCNGFITGNEYNCRGNGKIRNKVQGYNHASSITPFFVLTDLDRYVCPSELMIAWGLGDLNRNLIFRIAVREIESWILADIEGFSKYIGVASIYFPRNPDAEENPKRTLISLVKKTRKREIKSDIVPTSDFATIGPNYNGCLIGFVEKFWCLERAMERSESLCRAVQRLKTYTVS